MITAPTSGTFRTLTVDIVAGPPGEVDFLHATLPFTGDSPSWLTDQDVDDMIQIVVDRLAAAQPTYEVHVYRSWEGDNNSGPVVAYEPPS